MASRVALPATRRRGVAVPASPETKKAGFSTTHGLARQAPHKPRPSCKKEKAHLMPVCVSLGLIATSATLGLYAAGHKLLYAPDVCASKKRRETIPEVEDPDSTAAETDKSLGRSIFRRITHLRGVNQTPRTLEDLRTVGVDPRTS